MCGVLLGAPGDLEGLYSDCHTGQWGWARGTHLWGGDAAGLRGPDDRLEAEDQGRLKGKYGVVRRWGKAKKQHVT